MRPVRYVSPAAPYTGSWLPVDNDNVGTAISFFVTVSGAVSGTGSIEVTGDDIFNSAITPVAFAADAAALTAFVGPVHGGQTTPIRAARLNTSVSGTGLWIFTIVQQGIQ
jgi:hypothetical protein